MPSLKEEIQVLRQDADVDSLGGKLTTVLEQIGEEDLHLYVYDLFSPTIKTLENFLISNQLTGLQCLRRFLVHQHADDPKLSCWSILKENGYDQFVYLKLRHMLYKTDIATFDILMENIHFLLADLARTRVAKEVPSTLTNTKLLKGSLEMDDKLAEVFSQLLDNLLFCQSDSKLIQAHLRAMEGHLFPLLGCCALKFTKTFLYSTDALLEVKREIYDYDTMILTLTVQLAFLRAIHTNISSEECTLLLSRALKLLIKADDTERERETRLQRSITKLLAALELSTNMPSSVTETVSAFCQQTVASKPLWSTIQSKGDTELVSFFTRHLVSN